MYDNVSQNIFRNALQNISPPPATCFAPRGAKSRLKIRPSLYVSSPQLVIGLKASPPRVIKLKVPTMHRTSGFRRAVLQITSVLTQRSNIKRKPKRRITETRIEKKAQREANRIDQFHQRKRAGELTNGMALRNAALDSWLEQLDHIIKEEEIITISAKAEGEEAATWAAICAEQDNSIPHVLCAILYPPNSKCPRLSNWKSMRIVTSAIATRSSCALWSERSEPRIWPELAWATMLPGSAAQWLFWRAPWRSSETMKEKKHKSIYIGRWCATFHKILRNVMKKNTQNIFVKFNGKHRVIYCKTLSNISQHKPSQREHQLLGRPGKGGLAQ